MGWRQDPRKNVDVTTKDSNRCHSERPGRGGRASFWLAPWLVALALWTLPSPVLAADPVAQAQANRLVERGNEFVRKESLPRAKGEYLKALKADPQHLDARYNLAVVCERLGQPAEAIEHYRRYLEIRPADADVWTQLGVLFDQAGQQDEAATAYEKALALSPKFGRAHHNLGVLLKERGQLPAAERHLRQFVALEEAAGRRNGDAYYSLGVLCLEQRRVREAKVLLQQAVDTDPSRPLYNNALGDVYLLENKPATAEVHYKKALEKDPKYALAYSGLGDAYRQLNRPDDAAASYRKALELRPEYSLIHYKLGRLCEDRMPAEAIKHFEKYLACGKNLEFVDDVNARLTVLKALR
jgi:Tfp pilus assembly protein PilF